MTADLSIALPAILSFPSYEIFNLSLPKADLFASFWS